MERSIQVRAGFFEKLNKIDKPSSSLIKKKKKDRRPKSIKSNKKGEIIINITNIQRISNNYEQLHVNKMKNLEEIYIQTPRNIPSPKKEYRRKRKYE